MKILKKSILIVAVLIVNSVFAQNASKSIALEDIWASGKFYPKMVRGIRSMSDGEHYCTLEREKDKGICINEYAYKTNKKTRTIVSQNELIPAGDTLPITIDDYSFSADEKKILIATDEEAIYRHSTKSYYYIWDIESEELIKLSDGGKQRLATFSPSGSNVAFVRENNLFVKDIINNKEVKITKDGEHNNIINGATDWVYEEEFGFTKAFFWSPDGAKIAYYRFDESNVKQFNMTMYYDLYPEWYRFKYPKAGEDNSLVTIQIYDLNTKETNEMDIGSETDQYIPRIKWTHNPNKLAIQRMNRLQNHLEILLSDANTGAFEVIYDETNKYYIDITDNLTFFKDNQHFIITSELDGFNHIYMYSMKGEMVKQLTSGNWDVTEFKGISADEKAIFYVSAEDSPLQRALYSIDIKKGKITKLSENQGNNNPEFSKGMKYYINAYTAANTPHIYTIHDSKGKQIHELVNNVGLKERMEEYGFIKKTFHSFKTSEGVELNYYMMKPAKMEAGKEYPLLMFLYGGPGSQEVQDTWDWGNYLWFQYLTQQGFVVACIDNRGTGARGQEFKKCTYLQLGKLETIDQIEGAKYFGALDFIDKERIGIFGWSYGGYMSTLCMTKGADYFSTGIAVAPVTNWRYYDNIYTERFMRKPQDNADGYDSNSPINHIEKLKGKYLLVHGTADDNVHFQNALELVKVMVSKNIPFDMHMYPNKNHGIYGGLTRLHLFTKMTSFLKENL